MLSAKGTLFLAQKVGSPVSEVMQGYIAGRLFMRVKVLFRVDDSLKDRISLDHPTLGPITVHLVHERVPRLCVYCGLIGDEIGGCLKWGKVLQLCADPMYYDRPELPIMCDHRMGAWLTCAALTPSASLQQPNPFYPNLLSHVYTPSNRNSHKLSGVNLSEGRHATGPTNAPLTNAISTFLAELQAVPNINSPNSLQQAPPCNWA